jgi:hypothetical protein
MLPLVLLDTHILRRALFDASNPDDDPDGKLAAEAREVLHTVWAKCYPMIVTTKLESELSGRVVPKHGPLRFETVLRELESQFGGRGKLRLHTTDRRRQQELSKYGEDWHLFEAASSIRDMPVWLITREEWMLKLHASKHPGTVKPPWDFVEEAKDLKNCIEEPLPV